MAEEPVSLKGIKARIPEELRGFEGTIHSKSYSSRYNPKDPWSVDFCKKHPPFKNIDEVVIALKAYERLHFSEEPDTICIIVYNQYNERYDLSAKHGGICTKEGNVHFTFEGFERED